MKAVVINREDRPERLAWCTEQFNKWGMNVEVFPAVIDNVGWRGCRDSHLAILDKYRMESYIMVFEDDVLFLRDPAEPITNVFKEVPKDWDLLYLGVSPQEPCTRVSEHLFKVKATTTTHAMLYNNRQYGVVDYILNHKDQILKIDNFYSAVIHKVFNCYVLSPLLCTQKQFQSDTCKRSDVSTIEKNFKKYCI